MSYASDEYPIGFLQFRRLNRIFASLQQALTRRNKFRHGMHTPEAHLSKQIKMTMTKRLKTLLSLIFIMLTTVVMPSVAEDYKYMAVYENRPESSKHLIELSQFTAVRFGNSLMRILDQDTEIQTFSLPSVYKITFETDPTGIREVETTGDDEGIAVYTTAGICVRKGNADLSLLPKGIYIVKVGRNTYKVTNP
ncbi:MAG: hypothetical protein SPI30_03455 [Prevotella sp.]|nr:hypothetical protein [Prevotella sp.]